MKSRVLSLLVLTLPLAVFPGLAFARGKKGAPPPSPQRAVTAPRLPADRELKVVTEAPYLPPTLKRGTLDKLAEAWEQKIKAAHAPSPAGLAAIVAEVKTRDLPAVPDGVAWTTLRELHGYFWLLGGPQLVVVNAAGGPPAARAFAKGTQLRDVVKLGLDTYLIERDWIARMESVNVVGVMEKLTAEEIAARETARARGVAPPPDGFGGFVRAELRPSGRGHDALVLNESGGWLLLEQGRDRITPFKHVQGDYVFASVWGRSMFIPGRENPQPDAPVLTTTGGSIFEKHAGEIWAKLHPQELASNELRLVARGGWLSSDGRVWGTTLIRQIEHPARTRGSDGTVSEEHYTTAWSAVAWANGVFCAVGQTFDPGKVYPRRGVKMERLVAAISLDGVSWREVPLAALPDGASGEWLLAGGELDTRQAKGATFMVVAKNGGRKLMELALTNLPAPDKEHAANRREPLAIEALEKAAQAGDEAAAARAIAVLRTYFPSHVSREAEAEARLHFGDLDGAIAALSGGARLFADRKTATPDGDLLRAMILGRSELTQLAADFAAFALREHRSYLGKAYLPKATKRRLVAVAGQAGQLGTAARVGESYLKDNPGDDAVRLLLADCYMRSGFRAEAEAHLRVAADRGSVAAQKYFESKP